MGAVFTITFPIYAAIALGYVLVRMGWFSQADTRLFGRFVLNVALPALLFHALATRDVTEIFQPSYALVFMMGGIATIVLGWVWFRLTEPQSPRRALALMGISCPNSGFIGYPVMLLLLPDQAGLILGLNFLVENFVIIPLCLVLLGLSDASEPSPWRRVGTTLLNVLKMPLVIALLLGLGFSASGLALPASAGRVMDMLGASAAALSLISIGGALFQVPLTGNLWLALQIAGGKLILHPLVMAAVAFALLGSGWVTLSPDLLLALILSSAMPMLTVFLLFAQQRDLGDIASLSLLITTVLGFFTLSAALLILPPWLASLQ